jgi:hypothetical protein
MKTYAGQLGIVLLLDDKTRGEAIRLANEHGEGNSLDIGGQHTPHVTLYHSKLRDVPSDAVDALLEKLAAQLPQPLPFVELAGFGGTFLFWDIEWTESLVAMHESALSLSTYFDAAGDQPIEKENIQLSPEEFSNVKAYGHPLVRSLWRPHVTVGYYPAGMPLSPAPAKFAGAAASVAFVRIGEVGTIVEIIVRRS